jgi:iron complex outermembrane receptor protein
MRGFSNNLSNKLLVLIDGRSVYSPLYAGVFWDVQDTLLADVDRIEVVAGPGGTIWGANAVNGVINIITRSAAETQGGYAELGGGNEDEAIGAFRYGWKIGDKTHARAYVKHFDRDDAKLASGARARDGWSMDRAGFALDVATSESDHLDVRADAYHGIESAVVRGDFTLGTLPATGLVGNVEVAGRSVTAGWRHALSNDGTLRGHLYYDSTDRQIPGSFDENRQTIDVGFEHGLARSGRHDAQWGAGFRTTQDHIGNTLFATFDPASRSDQTLSAFVQDRIELKPRRLFLTLGTKLEHNDYTGFENQPNVRLAWLPSDEQTVWTAVSRAVRVPARLNTDLRLTAPLAIPGVPLPAYVIVAADPNFESEDLIAYEAGYRRRIGDKLSFDVALFDNHYDHLQTNEAGASAVVAGPPAYLLIPVRQANLLEGETYGGTFAASWQPLKRWRLQFQYAHLQMDLAIKPGGRDTNAPRIDGNSPKNQTSVQSYVELPHDLSLFTNVRFVDRLPTLGVPSYLAVDWSLGWRAGDKWRVALTATDANDASHVEFQSLARIERSVFLQASLDF